MYYDKIVLSRTVYSLVDWFNNLGSMAFFVQLVCSGLLPFIIGWSIEKNLIKKLYRKTKFK